VNRLPCRRRGKVNAMAVNGMDYHRTLGVVNVNVAVYGLQSSRVPWRATYENIPLCVYVTASHTTYTGESVVT